MRGTHIGLSHSLVVRGLTILVADPYSNPLLYRMRRRDLNWRFLTSWVNILTTRLWDVREVLFLSTHHLHVL